MVSSELTTVRSRRAPTEHRRATPRRHRPSRPRLHVDLSGTAPALSHWQTDRRAARAAPLLLERGGPGVLGAHPLRRHPRGVPDPRGVLQPLDRADQPGPGVPVPAVVQRSADPHAVPPADEPVVLAGLGRQARAAPARAGPRRGRGRRRRRSVRLHVDVRRPLPGRRLPRLDGPADGRRRLLRVGRPPHVGRRRAASRRPSPR